MACGQTQKATISLLEYVLSQKLLRLLTSREYETDIWLTLNQGGLAEKNSYFLNDREKHIIKDSTHR